MLYQSQLTANFDALVLFQDAKYSIEVYKNLNTGKSSIAVVKDQLYTDFPVIYWNDRSVAFDRPETLPEYIKAKVRSYAYNLD